MLLAHHNARMPYWHRLHATGCLQVPGHNAIIVDDMYRSLRTIKHKDVELPCGADELHAWL
eukprot:3098423-Amphidinium_carterae.1